MWDGEREAPLGTKASAEAERRSQGAIEEEAERFHVEREALDQLKAQTEQIVQELERQQASAKAMAEKWELGMLEQDATQIRLSTALAEEQSCLDQQRRHVLLLQNSVAERAQPVDLCVEMAFDDAGIVEEEDATPLLQQKGCIFAVQSPTKKLRVMAGRAKAHERAALQASTAEIPVEIPFSDEDVYDDVWDLDWNALPRADSVAPAGPHRGSLFSRQLQQRRQPRR